MADMMQVEIVSPEARIATIEAERVILPGKEGDFTVMARHVPMATSLRPGLVTVSGASGVRTFLVVGGFAEISGASVSVLAEFASDTDGAQRTTFDGHIEKAKTAVENADRLTAGELQRDLSELIRLVEKHAA